MINEDLEKIFLQLDKTGKIFQFRRKKLIQSIKESLMKNDYNQLFMKFNIQKQKNKEINITLQEKINKLDFLSNKYNLVSSILNATPPKNDAIEKLHYLITHDFVEFSNKEFPLAEEAKALFILQNIEKKLQNIIDFPLIYNKTIVGIGGGFSAGKSEFINSFFIDKQMKLPVGINPVTAIPTYIIAGKESSIKAYSYKGGVANLSASLYKKLSHNFIKSLGLNLKDIAPVIAIETPMESYENICFIDTPGYNSANTGYTNNDKETSTKYLKQANILLWVIDIAQGTILSSDLEFLESINLDNKKIYIIANKAETKSPEDRKKILDEYEEILDEYDIKYEGISAFNSIYKEELEYRDISLFNFLEEINNPFKGQTTPSDELKEVFNVLEKVNNTLEVETNILNEVKDVFNGYRIFIKKQTQWRKSMQSHLNSLGLDFLELGIDSEESNKRLDEMNTLFNDKSLFKKSKELDKLEDEMTQLVREVFIALS